MAKLGRGLKSLISGYSPAPQPGAPSPLKVVPVDQIRPNPRQPRRDFDEDRLQALAANLKANGLLQPVLVRQISDGYELIAGERRWRAAKVAGLATIPAIEQIADEARSLELALVENLLRDDLNSIELATAYRELAKASNLTQEELAARLGRSRAAVANTVRLLDLPIAIQEMVRAHKLSPGHARALLAVSDTRKQLALATRAADHALSVRELEALVYKPAKKRGSASNTVAMKAPHIAQIERALSERLGTKVTVREERKRRRGRITIEFYSNEDFERIVEIIGPSAGPD